MSRAGRTTGKHHIQEQSYNQLSTVMSRINKKGMPDPAVCIGISGRRWKRGNASAAGPAEGDEKRGLQFYRYAFFQGARFVFRQSAKAR